MKFDELENFMLKQGIGTLAEISRALGTTPQAVSNWKARNKVPFHVVAKITERTRELSIHKSSEIDGMNYFKNNVNIYEDDVISFTDILFGLISQIKLICLTIFIATFSSITYVKFILPPSYESRATILLPPSNQISSGGIIGIASQFGVNIPNAEQADLSSPDLLPDLLYSRRFAEKILFKTFRVEEDSLEKSLLSIIRGENLPNEFNRDRFITLAMPDIKNMVKIEQDPGSNFQFLKAFGPNPVFAKNLAEQSVIELENLHKNLKTITLNEKITFINQRIESVEIDLIKSEQKLKTFNENNRQIISPALQLSQDRLMRDVEIQKGIYLTLKQEFELAKIEEVQQASVLQVLDAPQLPIFPYNKNMPLTLILSLFLGLFLGSILGYLRHSLKNNPEDYPINKKHSMSFVFKLRSKEILTDYKVGLFISIVLLVGSPFYLGYESPNPEFLGMYSKNIFIINVIYVLLFLFSLISSVYNFFKPKSNS